MKNKYFHIIVIVLIAAISSGSLVAQETKKDKSRISIAYYKDYNDVQSVVAILKAKRGRYVPVSDAEVLFYNIGDTSKILLEKILTDETGTAVCLLKDQKEIHIDSSGRMAFEVEYMGNDSSHSASQNLEVKSLNLKTSFLQDDSIKFIHVEAREKTVDNTLIPVEELEISLYIKGTFSLLNIGQETTDEEGGVRINFPIEMPGDTAGNLTIVTKIEDNDDYGNVESMGIINWAKRVPLPAKEHRGLGDTDAPLWMVYTLIILLSAVWFHYMYVIYLIIKIKLARNRI